MGSNLNAVQPAVRACAGMGASGIAPMRIVFASEGHVSEASVSGGSLVPEARQCVAAAVRQARVPPFRLESFTVNYPFRL